MLYLSTEETASGAAKMLADTITVRITQDHKRYLSRGPVKSFAICNQTASY